jgi:hypothetical protein
MIDPKGEKIEETFKKSSAPTQDGEVSDIEIEKVAGGAGIYCGGTLRVTIGI